MIDFNFIALTIRDWAINGHPLGGADGYDKTVALLRQLAADACEEAAKEAEEYGNQYDAIAKGTKDECLHDMYEQASAGAHHIAFRIRHKAAEFLKASK